MGGGISSGGPRGSGKPHQGASTVYRKRLTPVSEDGLVSTHSPVTGKMWEVTPSSQGNQSNRVSDLRNKVSIPCRPDPELKCRAWEGPRLGAVEVPPGGPPWEVQGPGRSAIEADTHGQLMLEPGAGMELPCW